MSEKICVIDGEDDEVDDPVISKEAAVLLVRLGYIVECTGCSLKGTRAFNLPWML